MIDKLLKLISQEIERYDKLTDEYVDFPLDSTSYNIVAQCLRSVKQKIIQEVKEEISSKG